MSRFRVATYQLRLRAGPQEAVLDRYAAHMGRAERHLHVALEAVHRAAVAVPAPIREDGKPATLQDLKNDLKSAFMLRHGLTGRQYNSLLTGLEGRHDSLREIAKARIETMTHGLKRLESKISKRAKVIASFAKVAAEVDARAKNGRGPTKAQAKRLLSRTEYNKERFVQHQQKRRAQSLRDRIAATRADLAKDLPPVCFGSRELLRARGRIHSKDQQAFWAWSRHWDKSRAAGFLVLGSKDETSGCQGCVGMIDAEGRLRLRLRLPNALVARGVTHVDLDPMELPEFGRAEIVAALRAHTERDAEAMGPISYRFVRDMEGGRDRRAKGASDWRLCITLRVPAPEIRHPGILTGTDRRGNPKSFALGRTEMFRGAIGVDVNADHLAYAVIDRFGNPIPRQCGRIPLPLRGKGAGERRNLVGAAARDLVRIATDLDLPLIMERLDFKAKKRELDSGRDGAGYARMLSSFAYGQIQEAIRRRALRDGAELADVNPAYTSLIGRTNYAKRYGLSVHIAAAVSIARRGARLSERISYIRGLRGRRHLTLQAGPDIAPNEPRRHVWRQWASVQRERLLATTSRSRPAAGGSPSSGSSKAGKPAAPGPVVTRIPAPPHQGARPDACELEHLLLAQPTAGENDRAAAPRGV